MKEARYLMRVSNDGDYQPVNNMDLLSKARELTRPFKAKAINLRVTPLAIEFDLFCEPAANMEPILAVLQSIGKVITCKRLDLPAAVVDPQTIVAEARQLFNEHRFWEVHEVLEGLWKTLKGPEKELVQGLILAAAALVHAQKNEPGVVWPMLEDSMKRLEDQPPAYYGWDIAIFRDHFARVLRSKELDFPTV